MNARTVIGLVAGREIRVRMTSKSYLLATGALVAAVVLGGVLFKVVGSDDPTKVGFAFPAQGLAGPVTELAGKDEVTTRTVSSDAAGRTAVKDGDLDVLVTAAKDGRLEVVVENDLDPALEAVFTAVAQQQALADQITGLGGDPKEVTGALARAVPKVTELDPRDQDAGQVVAAYVVGILIFMGLITAGQLVAQGVVEEKTSRIVELLLATVKPWQLMAGKVLGIGIVGVAQLAAVTVASVVSATALGLLDTSDLNIGATALGALGWFVIGFASYAVLLAGLAALVSRQEEVNSVISPVTTLMVIPYVIGVSIGTWDPENPLVVWLSRIPFTSPLVMPIRIAGGGVAAWDVALAVCLSLAVIPLLVWVSGRLYASAVLQTGSRVRLLTALRAGARPGTRLHNAN